MTTTRPAGLSPRQSERRRRIIDATLELLGERSPERIQVRDVAEQAGVALGTVYHYFGSKEQLLAEALLAWAGTLGTSVRRRPVREGSAADRLTEVLHRAVRAFERRPQLARLVSMLEVSPDPATAEALSRLERVTTEVYLEQLRDVDPTRASGVVRVCDAVMSTLLRSWAAGKIPRAALYERLAETVRLLLA